METWKATARAPTNIAFVKYMGKDPRGKNLPDEQGANFPENGSISMCLDRLHSTTTVEFSPNHTEDVFMLDGEPATKEEHDRTFAHIDRIRRMAGMDMRARVESINNFGKSRGLSSSASGLAALSVAGAAAAGLTLTVEELSSLARKGSGSASRSVPDGYVEWKPPVFDASGNLVEDSTASSLYPAEYWDLADVVVETHTPAKEVSTTQAHGKVMESRYRAARLEAMPGKLENCKRILAEKNFTELGRLLEEETWDLHLLFISSGIRYIKPVTLEIMDFIEQQRSELEAYYTLNTGQDIHLICRQADAEELARRVRPMNGVKEVIINHPGKGAQLLEEHLF